MNNPTGPINNEPTTIAETPPPNPVDDLRRAFSANYSTDLIRKALELNPNLRREEIHHMTWHAFLAGHKHASKKP